PYEALTSPPTASAGGEQRELNHYTKARRRRHRWRRLRAFGRSLASGTASHCWLSAVWRAASRPASWQVRHVMLPLAAASGLFFHCLATDSYGVPPSTAMILSRY